MTLIHASDMSVNLVFKNGKNLKQYKTLLSSCSYKCTYDKVWQSNFEEPFLHQSKYARGYRRTKIMLPIYVNTCRT